ncbi:hypothetical protein V8G54_010143 [Vigna mungo]|uniref:Uncharacterized protein n=1 Tax=Vigna mungo TaxID=3915 RepID=A0AAQ3S653_VIGMU
MGLSKIKKMFSEKRFGVVTIVYSGKLRKNHKIVRHGLRNQRFEFESRLRVGKVLAPHNACPKVVPLIKYANLMWFSKCLISPKNKLLKKTKIFFCTFYLQIIEKIYLENIWILGKVNLTRTDLAPTYLHF